jgi:hypothetical protein
MVTQEETHMQQQVLPCYARCGEQASSLSERLDLTEKGSTACCCNTYV